MTIIKLNRSHQLVHENLINSKETNKRIYDRKLNNQVFRWRLPLPVKRQNQNREIEKHIYNGPYRIVEINSSVNCKILIGTKPTKLHMNR